MKRFIDLRGQHTGYRFAWWDTVRDCFDEYAGDQAWDTWDEFLDSVRADDLLRVEYVSDRLSPLVPAWAFEPDPDDDHEEDTGEHTR